MADLADRLEQLRDEFRSATLDFVAGYGPLRESTLEEWREASRHLNGSAERLLATMTLPNKPSSRSSRPISAKLMIGVVLLTISHP